MSGTELVPTLMEFTLQWRERGEAQDEAVARKGSG